MPVEKKAYATLIKLFCSYDKGREKLYRLQPEPLKELKDWLSFYEQFWNNKLSMLKHVVENEAENGLDLIETKFGKQDK